MKYINEIILTENLLEVSMNFGERNCSETTNRATVCGRCISTEHKEPRCSTNRSYTSLKETQSTPSLALLNGILEFKPRSITYG